MIISLDKILQTAQKEKIAIGAFNIPNLESARAITSAAQEVNRPVILNYAEGHSTFLSMEEAYNIMRFYAQRATVPVCIHLDHGSSFEACMKAMQLGFSGVMIDASAKSFQENITETQQVVKVAHAFHIGVEAELGHILAHEKGITADNINVEDTYTNPDLAKKFIEETKVDALAIAFGTAHGLYLKKPVLDLDRIVKIKAKKDIPYVMHGGSGLSKEEFQQAVKNGIRKINFYTYMSLAGGKAVKQAMDQTAKGDNVFFHDIPLIAESAMKEIVKNAILTFSLMI
jgi:fructose-bisphosphate aldolase class II